ncbi:response regulator [Imbroritus primus]|uniref:Response regulator n=1 Tax=Imbroritus primus TaxID=3058603 RepID=A0ACD3SQD0_9BURK|nr:response regulator [Burkholderiaceae bacterium PBA]
MSEANTSSTMTSPTILFVDDEPTAVKYFERVIGAIAPVLVAGSVSEGRALLEAHGETLKVLVSDQRMPGEYGNVLLSHAAERFPHIVRILTTAYSELDDTVEAINLGQIHRYIRKPWDVRGLRLEIMQALDLATLLGERDELLREKIGINHRHMLLSRIGAVRSIGMMAGMTETFDAMEVYFSTAAAVGLRDVALDWNVLDYTDLIALEAERSGGFGQATRAALQTLQGVAFAEGHPLARLQALLGDAVSMPAGDVVTIHDATLLTEFLEGGPQTPVRPQAAGWLAFLLWLAAHGVTLQTAVEGGAMQCRLLRERHAAQAGNLAAWIELF